MDEDEMRIAINNKITECWDKMVRDSKQIAGTNFNRYGEDLLAHVLDEFLNKKDITYQYQVAVIDNKLPNFIGRNMSMQIRSKTSPFWHMYRKSLYNSRGAYLADSIDKIDESSAADYNLIPEKDRTQSECVQWVLENELDWYEKIIIEKIYLEKWTRSKFQAFYNLPNNSLNKDIKSTLNKFRKLCSSFI